MKTKIAINGFGRIGRCILRAVYEEGYQHDIEVVGVNNTVDPHQAAFLLKHDTTHGLFKENVAAGDGYLSINGSRIPMSNSRELKEVDWSAVCPDVVCECTGQFTSREQASVHLDTGASKVLISAPGKPGIDATVVYGVNHETLKPQHLVVSSASCTTNCLAVVVKVFQEAIGIEYGILTTVHAYTNDQKLIDSAHKDLRRARSATSSIIPTKTGAATAVALVIPEMEGRLRGYAVRVPTINVSMVELALWASRNTSAEEINDLMQQNAASDKLKGILKYCDEPLVSVDFNHDSASSIFDSTLTQVMGGRLCKIFAWYDNEWGYACRMLDLAKILHKQGS